MSIFTGAATALITPFKDGKIDYVSMGKIIEWQIEQKIDALVVCGTTGESSTLSDEEKVHLTKFAVDLVGGRVPVIAGAGTNCTKSSIELSNRMEDAGADGLLIVTPYYNKCSDTGLTEHYISIANSTSLPIIMYSVPSRTGVNISPKIVEELSLHPNIVAIKEASGNISQICQSAAFINDDFNIYSGNDDQTVPILSLGGIGCISTVSNIIPRRFSKMIHNFLQGAYSENVTDKEKWAFKAAGKEQVAIKPLIDAMFAQVNPIPVKYAMSLMGLCQPEYRLPLCMPDNKTQYLIYNLLQEYGLI